MAKFFQVAIRGCKPCGGLFLDAAEAQREIRFLRAEDRRHAAEAMESAGITTPPTHYEVVEVDITL